MRSTIALAFAVALTALTAAVATAGDSPGHLDRDKNGPIANVWLETNACPGFSTANPLLFAGTAMGMYRHWPEPEPLGEEEGWTRIKVSATDGAHSFAIHQRYVFPRAPRDYVSGFATTVVARDDGATMTGWSVLSFDPFKAGNGAYGVWWIGAPTCS